MNNSIAPFACGFIGSSCYVIIKICSHKTFPLNHIMFGSLILVPTLLINLYRNPHLQKRWNSFSLGILLPLIFDPSQFFL